MRFSRTCVPLVALLVLSVGAVGAADADVATAHRASAVAPTGGGTAPAAVPATAAATTYYVNAVSGSDTRAGTSPETAWKSLAKANAVTLTPGTSILLARGSSWTGPLRPAGSGSDTASAVIGAYGTGAAPVVRGASTCVAVTGDHVVVRDLEVRACSWAGIEMGGSHGTIQRNYVTDTAAGVYLPTGAEDNKVVRNQLVDNDRMSVLTTAEGGDSGAFGVLLHGDRNTVAHNTISGSDAFSYDYGRDGAAVEIHGGSGNDIHHNVAVDNDAFAELGEAGTADNTFAYNDVRSALKTSVFVVTRGAQSSDGPILDTELLNNTVLLTGAQSEGFVCHAGCGPDILKMRNNIIQAVAKVGHADAPFDDGTGVYHGGQVQFKLAASSVVADPRFVDAARGDLHLRADSPAVDIGVTVDYARDLDGTKTPVDGDGDGAARTDAGAYERR